MDKKIVFKVKIGLTLIDLNQIFPIKPSEFKIKYQAQSKVMMKKPLKIAENATLPKSGYFPNYRIIINNNKCNNSN